MSNLRCGFVIRCVVWIWALAIDCPELLVVALRVVNFFDYFVNDS